MPPQVLIKTLDHSSGTAPFLKWLGGKRWLLREGVQVPVLDTSATYYEPFVGAGSMYFALAHPHAVLGDINHELIVTYAGVRDHLDAIVKKLSGMPNDATFYNEIRTAQPRSTVSRSARFLYLNRTAYGGVYRVNRQGGFNVPFGNYTDRLICQKDVLARCSAALSQARICHGGFEQTAGPAKAGDFVYLDPPYNAGYGRHGELFDRYHNSAFGWDAHERLAAFATELSARGVHVLVSNTHHPDVARLYAEFNVRAIKRKSMLSRDPVARGVAEEALYYNY